MNFVEAVRIMRSAQKDHERIRSQESLTKKREAEEEVDNMLKRGLATVSRFVESDARKLAVMPFPWSREEFEHPNFKEPQA